MNLSPQFRLIRRTELLIAVKKLSLLCTGEDCKSLRNLLKRRTPLRVTHNDTKLNNVLLTATATMLFALSTLTRLCRVLRFMISATLFALVLTPAPRTTIIMIRLSLCLIILRRMQKGFLSEAGDALNQCEIDNLAFSPNL